MFFLIYTDLDVALLTQPIGINVLSYILFILGNHSPLVISDDVQIIIEPIVSDKLKFSKLQELAMKFEIFKVSERRKLPRLPIINQVAEPTVKIKPIKRKIPLQLYSGPLEIVEGVKFKRRTLNSNKENVINDIMDRINKTNIKNVFFSLLCFLIALRILLQKQTVIFL